MVLYMYETSIALRTCHKQGGASNIGDILGKARDRDLTKLFFYSMFYSMPLFFFNKLVLEETSVIYRYFVIAVAQRRFLAFFDERKIEAFGGVWLATPWLLNITLQK